MFVCLSVVRSITKKTNDPKVFKLGVGNELVIPYIRSDWVQRSKLKVTGSITLHFQLQVHFSHSLGGDTSTITLQPHFVVIRYSLGGDTDNSSCNTA